MATLPQQPADAAHRSLQINIDSEADAKAVIQHLQAIKDRYDILRESDLVDSIEFCIAASVRRLVESDLLSAVRWCRTWMKTVSPFEGNVHYALPHYVPGPARATKAFTSVAITTVAPSAPAPDAIKDDTCAVPSAQPPNPRNLTANPAPRQRRDGRELSSLRSPFDALPHVPRDG